MIHSTRPVAASPKWLRIKGGRIFVPGSRPCRIPPRPSQIESRTKPPPAVTTHAISAAHSIFPPPFDRFPRAPPQRRSNGIRFSRASGFSRAGARALTAPAVRNRRPAIAAECLRRQADARWGLPALVLRAVDQGERPLDDVRVETVGGELFARAVLLDVCLEDAVERRIGWERVLVELVRPQLRARRPLEHGSRDEVPAGALVEVPREAEDVSLEHVLQEREPARHVPVERRVADR